MALVLVGAVLLLCFLPALLFLGFWHGLVRLQRSGLVARTCDRAGYTDPAVTWGDVVDAYTDPQRRLVGPSSTTRDEQCPACAEETDTFASYCHNCFRKLE